MKNNNDYIEAPKEDTVILGGWNQQIKTFPTVEIPLDEYKEFIEFKVKGQTVEIALEEYNRLKTSEEQARYKFEMLKQENAELKAELSHRQEVKLAIMKQKSEIEEEIKTVLSKIKNVSDSVTELKEGVRNGRI